jgi:hypothetical protein
MLYPLELRESTLAALRRESQALATLPYEAASWVVLSPAGEPLKIESRTEFKESHAVVDMADLICSIYEANGAEPGGGAIVMHNHLVPGQPGETLYCLPSGGDLRAIKRLDEGLRGAGLVLMDFVISGRPGTHGWSWRESLAAEAGEPLTESARPPQTNWDRRCREQERLWGPVGGVPWR